MVRYWKYVLYAGIPPYLENLHVWKMAGICLKYGENLDFYLKTWKKFDSCKFDISKFKMSIQKKSFTSMSYLHYQHKLCDSKLNWSAISLL